MNLRRVLLWATAAIGAFVGLWGAIAPDSFYASFPGFGRVWIAIDGPFNEHLIRDVGALYLALAAASIAAALSDGPRPGQVVGVAWTVFGLPHLIYHVTQFGGMPTIDVVGNVVSLGGSLLLGVVLMLPEPRRTRAGREKMDMTKENV